MKKPLFGSVLVVLFSTTLLFAAARRPEMKPRAHPTPAALKAPEPEPTPTPAAESTTQAASLSVILIPNSKDDPAKLVDVLVKNPDLHVSLIFPKDYFETQERRAFIEKFRTLNSSKQIEIGLSLDNEPVLPLLGDLRLAGEAVQKWGFNFIWPDDMAAQVARGSAKYQKRWAVLPNGFYPPYQFLSEKLVNTLTRFRLNWVVGAPNETWGVRFYGGTGLLIPPALPVFDEVKNSETDYVYEIAEWSLQYPFVLIDSSGWSQGSLDATLLDQINKKMTKQAAPRPFVTARAFVETLRDQHELAREANPFTANYDEWVSSPRQKRTWQALSEARKALEDYKDSGRANVNKLDAAVEEMCGAESGVYLRPLETDDPTVITLMEKSFLATLSNIYRLCDTPIPPALNSWFQNRSWQKASSSTGRATENDRTFFIESGQSLTWNDPKGDDNGDGKFTYPIGHYPKGYFDLREVTLRWDESTVTFFFSVADQAEKMMSVAPMVDIYIDVNRLAGAGNTSPLRDRRNTIIVREAAWEYAISMDPTEAMVYQAIPGAAPRFVQAKRSMPRADGWSVSVERKYLRGDPRRWRLSVGLSGTEAGQKNDSMAPVSIMNRAGERNFGGSSGTKPPAPYIDLLTSTADDQVQRIESGQNGGTLALPYVEAP